MSTAVDDGVPLLHANGVDGATGDYLTAPMAASTLARFVAGLPDDAAIDDLRLRRALGDAHFGLRRGFDPDDLGDTGWGVLFAHDADPAIRDALAPLLDLRRAQADARAPRYREYAGARGHVPGLDKNAFLAANGSAPGPVDPDRVPYYLLIVGDPEAIPFEFQYQLDVQHAVGRIAFDAPEQYARYAQAVVAAETAHARRPARVAFFAPRNPADPATALSADHLAAPLAKAIGARYGARLAVDAALGADATKARLAALVGGGDAPALLFTASHGVAFPADDPRWPRHQGAFVCQDWPGPGARAGGLDEGAYYSADDALRGAGTAGMIGVHFACYGAGTPRLDAFPAHPDAAPRPIAPRSAVSPLARALLSHPGGAALAFVGHVERAWAFSFLWPGSPQAQRGIFEDALLELLEGRRVGHAMEAFNARHAELATDLTAMLTAIRNGRRRDDAALVRLWTAHSDARNVVIVGDPAVRVTAPVRPE